MRLDDGNTTFYSVHIFTVIRLMRPGSREFGFRCGVLGELRDGVQKGVHSYSIIHGVFVGSSPWFCNLAPFRTELSVLVLCSMLLFVGGLTRSKVATTTTTLQYSHFPHTLVTHQATKAHMSPPFNTPLDPLKSAHDNLSFYNTINLATSCRSFPIEALPLRLSTSSHASVSEQ